MRRAPTFEERRDYVRAYGLIAGMRALYCTGEIAVPVTVLCVTGRCMLRVRFDRTTTFAIEGDTKLVAPFALRIAEASR